MNRPKKKYAKLNHLQITVRDAVRSRDWYVKNIGLPRSESEVPQQGFVALEAEQLHRTPFDYRHMTK